MKKPSLQDALATKAPAPVAPVAVPEPEKRDPKVDAKVATTLHIRPADLKALKIIAANNPGVKVNDLILEGVAHVLALHGVKQ